jgi:biotin transport system substrate-specific component
MNTETINSAGKLEAADSILGVSTPVWVRVVGVVGFAAVTTVGARIAIPLPGTPVPMTLQTLFVLLAGITLGSRLGALSMLFYLLLGTTGYHVFAAGNWGLNTVFGATGGYLIGFVLAQPVLGTLTRPRHGLWPRLLLALLAGNAIVFASGLSWLALWSGGGLEQTLRWGLWPFVPGLILKTAVALGAGGLAATKLRRFFDRD